MASTKDHGPHPHVFDIEALTKENDTFRTAVWTGRNLQLTVMSIAPGGDVGLEVHEAHDQFLRIESGEARVEMGAAEEHLDFVETAKDDFAVLVPAGTWHNITNTGGRELKLYSIYAPAEHPHGTVHETPPTAD